jgi:lysophospholipase L1-like esterase
VTKRRNAAGSLAGTRLSLKKKLWFAGITLVGLPILVLGLGEFAGRIYVYARYGQPGKSYGIYMADDELGATHRPNSYNSNSVINNWGLRNVEDTPEQKPAGALRVYCSGGSTTFCYNLETADSWPSALQRELRRRPGHERDDVLNAGQICFSLAHEYCLAKRLIPRLRPDAVIIYTGINELPAALTIRHDDGQSLDELLSQQRWGVCAHHLDQAAFWKRNSVLVRFWDYRIKRLVEDSVTARFDKTGAPPGGVHPWVYANFEHTLRDYLAFLNEHGCRVIVLRYGDNGDRAWHLRECIRVLRDRAVAVGKEAGATVCDVVARVEQHPRRQELFTKTGVHVTKEGADLFAEELCQTLLGEGGRVAAKLEPGQR